MKFSGLTPLTNVHLLYKYFVRQFRDFCVDCYFCFLLAPASLFMDVILNSVISLWWTALIFDLGMLKLSCWFQTLHDDLWSILVHTIYKIKQNVLLIQIYYLYYHTENCKVKIRCVCLSINRSSNRKSSISILIFIRIFRIIE